MSATPARERIELSPAVRAVLEADRPNSQLLKYFLRYLEALLEDPAGLGSTVPPDVRCHELEGIGYPRGLEGLRMFRKQVNAVIPDEHILITAVRFEGDDIIEADMEMNATAAGEFMGVRASGQKIRFDVHARSRFIDGRMAERWDQVDFEDIRRQLTGPIH